MYLNWNIMVIGHQHLTVWLPPTKPLQRSKSYSWITSTSPSIRLIKRHSSANVVKPRLLQAAVSVSDATKGCGSITATEYSCVHSNYTDYEQVFCEIFNNKEPSRFTLEYTSIPTDLVLLLYVYHLFWRPSVGHRWLSHIHHICNCWLTIRNT